MRTSLRGTDLLHPDEPAANLLLAGEEPEVPQGLFMNFMLDKYSKSRWKIKYDTVQKLVLDISNNFDDPPREALV